MNTNNKKTIISGILFMITAICYSLFQISFGSVIKNQYKMDYLIAWEKIIFTTIGAIFLMLYCIILHKTKLGKIFYLLGFGIWALTNIYFVFSTDGRFDLHVMSDILFFTITIFMLLLKVKPNKIIFGIGTTVFIIYSLIQFVAVISDTYIGFPIIVPCFLFVYLIARFIACFNLWLLENCNLTFKKESKLSTKTSLENNLISIKQLFDNGEISEEEYNQKRKELLKEL